MRPPLDHFQTPLPMNDKQEQTSAPSAKLKQRTLFSFFGKKTAAAAGSAASSSTPKATEPIVPTSPSSISTSQKDDTKAVEAEPELAAEPPHFPPTPSLTSEIVPPTSDSFSTPKRARSAISYAESDDEDSNLKNAEKSRRPTRRRRIVADDDDEADEYVPPASSPAANEDEEMLDAVDEDEDLIVSDDEKPKPAVSRQPRKPRSSGALDAFRMGSTSDTPSASESTSRMSTPSMSSGRNNVLSRDEKRKVRMAAFEKTNAGRYEWLLDIRDADGNRPTDEDYDPRTLYIPPSAWASFKPFEKQYWEIKKNLMDTVVFFQKGKFYELYENDAAIGHQVFALKLTDRVNMKMVGIPEATFEYWAAQFIAKGYRIARVDQLETALGKEMKDRKNSKREEKVVQRGLTQVLTSGTLVDESMLTSDMSTYCMALKEAPNPQSRADGPLLGVCFVDTATGIVRACEFQDDISRTKLDTLLTQIRPRELLLEKSGISQKTMRTIKNGLSASSTIHNIKPYNEFWDQERTVREFDSCDFFDEHKEMPDALRNVLDKNPLAASAVGALVWYLRQLKLDKDIFSMGNFHIYDASQQSTSLLLNGQTLKNLEIFNNSFDGGEEGTLFRLMCRCVTPFGKRLFHSWMNHPLRSPEQINGRLDVVELLLDNPNLRDAILGILHKLPDLERMISRVHASRCKPIDFLRILEGFKRIDTGIHELKEDFGTLMKGTALERIVERMPDMASELDSWSRAFSWSRARDEGVFVPEPGFEPEYDESKTHQNALIDDLHELLNRYKKELKCSSLTFKDIGKEVYQVEVPVDVKVPVSWCKMSGTKKFNRYYTDELRKKIKKLLESQETHFAIEARMQDKFYARFDEKYSDWVRMIKAVASMDCLYSLALASAALGEPCCRPEILDQEQSEVTFEELRHPCVSTLTAGTFVPNDVQLGGMSANMIVLTGPNMAGKSTLLRQTCLAVIMAQLGCYVPAKHARLTPMDSIHTRLGANDDIMSSRSTFMVELSETKKILDESTPRTLVILDELGRGTSTYDGQAIAYAVLHHLVSNIGCLGFFSTHYQSLCTDFVHHKQLRMMQMSALVDEAGRRVTFLYKLVDGVCSKSYGMNVASMASVPEEVVQVAETKSLELEEFTQTKQTESDAITLASDFFHLCSVSANKKPLQTLRLPLILDSFL
ncbi:MutS protein [Schizosaccharomyces japonicus yFS275]|uniref:DNA mismatch repair protein n=1 Tax=Schizosaccharomyces japonicus (strain yFS275 / FY16936) TaxID=402676 RepID=B6K126_SCHJY|nr:MutS protein [Schizosaccharomyces japonicus yFS275]EEB07647.1 MutS protein [Schizosaccharomyces japonicus yFS275]